MIMAINSQTKNTDFGALPNLGGAPIEMMPTNRNPKYASVTSLKIADILT